MFGSRFCMGRVNAMEQSKGGNRTLYFWQGMACLSVVLIHCMLPTGLCVIACALARFAVPLFFMVSGYYLRRDDMTNAQVHESEAVRRAAAGLGAVLSGMDAAARVCLGQRDGRADCAGRNIHDEAYILAAAAE